METIDRPALTQELDRAITRVLLAAGALLDKRYESLGGMQPLDCEAELELAMAELDNEHWKTKPGEQQ